MVSYTNHHIVMPRGEVVVGSARPLLNFDQMDPADWHFPFQWIKGSRFISRKFVNEFSEIPCEMKIRNT